MGTFHLSARKGGLVLNDFVRGFVPSCDRFPDYLEDARRFSVHHVAYNSIM